MPVFSDFFNDIANSFKRATGVTIQTITQNQKTIERLVAKHKPQIESMEGAAFFYVCLNEYVKFMQIRSVSNKVGEENTAKWDTPKALEALKEAMKTLFSRFA